MHSLPPELFRLAYASGTVCLAVNLAISSLEYLVLLREFEKGGAFGCKLIEAEQYGKATPLRRISGLLDLRAIACLLAVRFLCAFALLFMALTWQTNQIIMVPLAAVLVSGALLQYRCAVALEGGDLMSTIVAAGLLVAALQSPSSAWALIGFSFISAQACLSYFASGVAKAASGLWRDGSAVYAVMRTGTHGHRRLAHLLRDHPLVSHVLCWAVIAFEISFPLVLVMPSRPAVVLLLAGVAFHAGNAIVIGLNAFGWSFLATYPALWYCHQAIAAALARHS